MKDNRLQNNPANQNEEYYTLKSFRESRDGIRIGDYYLMIARPIGTTPGFRERGKYKRFALSKEVIKGVSDQFSIRIKSDWVGTVLESVDWEAAHYKGTTWDFIVKPDIHKAFNAKRLEMGL